MNRHINSTGFTVFNKIDLYHRHSMSMLCCNLLSLILLLLSLFNVAKSLTWAFWQEHVLLFHTSFHLPRRGDVFLLECGGVFLQIRLSNGVSFLITVEHHRQGGWSREGCWLVLTPCWRFAHSLGCLLMTMLSKYAVTGADFCNHSYALNGGWGVLGNLLRSWIMN